jgi:hypothetical protein
MARQTETLQTNMELVGFVTLSNQEREKPPSRVISSDRSGPTPRAHRCGSKGSVGMSGCERQPESPLQLRERMTTRAGSQLIEARTRRRGRICRSFAVVTNNHRMFKSGWET